MCTNVNTHYIHKASQPPPSQTAVTPSVSEDKLREAVLSLLVPGFPFYDHFLSEYMEAGRVGSKHRLWRQTGSKPSYRTQFQHSFEPLSRLAFLAPFPHKKTTKLVRSHDSFPWCLSPCNHFLPAFGPGYCRFKGAGYPPCLQVEKSSTKPHPGRNG